ncbi:hypothetical protein EI94DRAFT_1807635 [Lactarius quietus]|nr:hypothetical protein EI94DRAFT_1807635 [Lactarius quietus]
MSSYRRFVKDEEDIDRLPWGMKRTGYDASTRQYTFHDSTTGVEYISAPGERYGTLLPAATANYVKPKLGPGRRETLQAYDRPVFFADDLVQPASHTPSRSHKSAPNSPTSYSSSTRISSSRSHKSASSPPPSYSSATPKSGKRHSRSATFSDFLPASLIDRASPSEPQKAPPRPPPKSPTPTLNEKGHHHWSDEKVIEPVSRQYPGDKGGAREGLRSTARVLGRSVTTVRGHRSQGRERDHDGYVLV